MALPFIPLLLTPRVSPLAPIEPIVPMAPMTPQSPAPTPDAALIIPLLTPQGTPPTPPGSAPYTGPGSTPDSPPFPLYGEAGIPYAAPRLLPAWAPIVGAGFLGVGVGLGLLWLLRR